MLQPIIVETPAIVIDEMRPVTPVTIPVSVYDPLIHRPINPTHGCVPSKRSSAIVTSTSLSSSSTDSEENDEEYSEWSEFLNKLSQQTDDDSGYCQENHYPFI